jgi:CBS domain-containing protein
MKVADVLKGSSEVLTIKEDDDLALAGQMMAWARIRHLPVVRDGRVVGLLSQTDVLRHRSAPEEGVRQRVAAAMSQPAEVIGPEADLAEASARMLDRRLGCLPVVDSGRLIGIVTTSDILAVHVQATRAAPAPITVADVMTRAPHTARPEDNLLDAIVRMSRAGDREERNAGCTATRACIGGTGRDSATRCGRSAAGSPDRPGAEGFGHPRPCRIRSQ